jgi:hypothetical protein
MEPMICKAYVDEDGHVMVQAVGGEWEGCMSHGATLQEAFANFGEAATLFDETKAALPISGGAIAPLALMLLPLLPQLIDSAMRIYEQIANHPTTPEATGAQIRGYITNIRAINAQIQAAPLPGDEP